MTSSNCRRLLLLTIPGMIASLMLLAVTSLKSFREPYASACSLLGLAAFCCSFVTGFGPIPNIICAEIFPTRVRGISMSLCAGSMWLCTIAVSQAFPIMQHILGLGGVFAVFAAMSTISWVFIYYQVPETKGLPLEIICDLFAASASGRKHHRE